MARVERVDVAVVGGGIAGLSAAHEAVSRGLSVALFEAGDAVGGKMASRTVDGYLVECGPHSFLSSAARLWQLIDRVRLRSRVMQARPPADRFVYRGGTLRKLPSNPLTALSGDWMTYAGRARAAWSGGRRHGALLRRGAGGGGGRRGASPDRRRRLLPTDWSVKCTWPLPTASDAVGVFGLDSGWIVRR